MKRLLLDENKRKEVTKEILIHQHLKHQNIIKLIEVFESSGYIFIVQELADGGELFEQIEPDVGFPEQVAHFYFVQLIRSIVSYKEDCRIYFDLCFLTMNPKVVFA